MYAGDLIELIRTVQRDFQQLLTSSLQTIHSEHTLAAYITLALIGFGYGALHAIGPGHGKVIVSTYLLANKNSLRRGLLIVGLASLLQAFTAIGLISIFHSLLQSSRTDTDEYGRLLELASMVLVGGLGLWLMFQGVRLIGNAMRVKATQSLPEPSHSQHHHHHHHEHGCCGHAHSPTLQQIEQKQPLGASLAMIAAIGLRPCTGALIMLYFASALGLFWAGIFATLAMAFGTALVTSLIALLTVKSRDLAERWVVKSERGLALTYGLLRLVGGGVILVIAGLFILANTQNGVATSVPNEHPLFRTPQ